MLVLGKQSLADLVNKQTREDRLLSSSDSNKFFGKALSVLLAIGLSDEQIARILEVDRAKLDEAKFNTNVVETSLMIQTALGYTPEQKIAATVAQALEAKIRILHETCDDKLKNSIATEIIERHMGKPVQMQQTVNVNMQMNVSNKDLDAKIRATAERVQQLEKKKNLLLEANKSTSITTVVEEKTTVVETEKPKSELNFNKNFLCKLN